MSAHRQTLLRTGLFQSSYHAVVSHQSPAPQYSVHAGHCHGYRNFYWPGMDAAIEAVARACAVCQKCKITAVKKYGKIPLPTHRDYAPWEEIHVDLIGPWDVRYNSSSVPGKTAIEKIQALTIIDKGTGWPELIAIHNKTSYHVAISFDSEWLCRYPRPYRVVYDNGAEFTGQEFQELLESYGIKPVATTVRNPRSNGVIECVHLTMGDMLRTMTFSGSDWFTDTHPRCSRLGHPHYHQPSH
jgi:hypothetical protein